MTEPNDDAIDGESDTIDRRSILKGMAAGAIASAGAVGTAAASPGAPSQNVDFDQGHIEETLLSEAGDVLSTVADEGHVSDIAELPTDDHVAVGEFIASSSGTTVLTPDIEGVSTKSIRTKVSTDTGELTLVAEPDDARSYAIMDPDGEDVRYVRAPEASDIDGWVPMDEEVVRQAETDCTDNPCDIGLCVGVVTRCFFGYCFESYECICGC